MVSLEAASPSSELPPDRTRDTLGSCHFCYPIHMPILDSRGQPIQRSIPRASGGSTWVETHALNAQDELLRARVRIAYFSNALIYSAVQTVKAFVLGDGVSYGEMHDQRAQDALEGLWHANDLTALAERMLTEYLIDGESLTLFPTRLRSRNVSAKVGLFDVSQTLRFDLEPGNPSKPVRITANKVAHDENQFVWLANDALWNTHRGVSPFSSVIDIAQRYADLLKQRYLIQRNMARIIAVYKTLIYSTTAEGALEEHREKLEQFGRLPEGNAVIDRKSVV